MIAGIGIDTVEIKRFSHWQNFASAQLQRLFSIEEIAYCLETDQQSAARFAVRFAAREAFLKALQAGYPTCKLSLLYICTALSITRNDRGLPKITVNWPQLRRKYPELQQLTCHISLSHSGSIATAIVLLEKNPA